MEEEDEMRWKPLEIISIQFKPVPRTLLPVKNNDLISSRFKIDSYFTMLPHSVSIRFKLVLTLLADEWRTKLDNTEHESTNYVYNIITLNVAYIPLGI